MVGNLVPYLIMLAATGFALLRDAPYATPLFIVVMAAWYTVRMVLTQGASLEVKEERDAKRERPLAGVVGVGMIFLPLLTLATPLLDFAAYTAVPGQLAIGAVVAVIGVYLFWRSHADLGPMWSAHLEVREGHRLITHGIYSRIRHPMYSAIFLITLGQTLILTNWIAGPIGLVAFTALYLIRIGPEERMMADQFGAAWANYAAKTPRLVPRWATGAR
ncbi:protein-S-isoprenylcysteine O-methyltransferase [Cognatiyoonia sp. IB215446]|uniref:protein-S-isoprenylcysteine O-methyltransferase n=1 Tax=Cognatiyoonia sp. IB215446 TaxID=3097355 RepID=UPI002A132061|nr:protein-S-isoprenylcysteine O-methyltransferase [Cognatiyoonia sp. IB215446]MDX8350416.1 protein-S-isoprenylcysteine O-methyltransferase [Cognatiyoonia sp. IB215446]